MGTRFGGDVTATEQWTQKRGSYLGIHLLAFDLGQCHAREVHVVCKDKREGLVRECPWLTLA